MINRYKIEFDKIANQLTPHYLRKRSVVLFLQSLLYPLQEVNRHFETWCFETMVKATITSQKISLEWYLNRLFSDKFKKSSDRIQIKTISENEVLQTPLLLEKQKVNNVAFYREREGVSKGRQLFFEYERYGTNPTSFSVICPTLSQPSEKSEIVSEISNIVGNYKLTNKTFKIIMK